MEDPKQNHPPSNSPALALLHPTAEEKLTTWSLNGKMWRGRLSMSQYLRREQCLENQAFTRNGGITFWVLVDTTAPPNGRPIFASCESLRKRALIAKGDGSIKDITSHGVGSVFVNPDFRGRGYAQRMITELGKKLDIWQQEDGRRTDFTVLYSDIGKKFYSKMNWHAFPSSHIALPPIVGKGEDCSRNNARLLYAHDLAELCALDEKMLREEMARPTSNKSKVRVALIPDIETIQWHHAREDFAAQEMIGRDPDIKGAYVRTGEGHRVWCVWTRTFGNEEAGNTLNILRLVVEGEGSAGRQDSEASEQSLSSGRPEEAKIRAGAAVLRAAQIEAAKWDMKDVQVWNPTNLIVSAARDIDPSIEITHRDEESIASLRWHGVDAEDHAKVEWVGNEKYGWC